MFQLPTTSDALPAADLLIVDDDPGTIKLLASMLDDMGEIRFATNGEDALRMVRAKPPDLILLDAMMPGMNGFDLCKTLKRNPELGNLPILFITARTDMESEVRALDAGAVDFITKPPNPPIVRARVRTHLTLKQRTDQLRRLSSIDFLTGIPNRRAFDTALEQEWRRAYRTGNPLFVLMIDVDCFKSYNDHYGHQAGDDCLRAIAGVLKSSVNRSGEAAARYGGEEFAVVLPGSNAEEALLLAEKMRMGVSALNIPHARSEISPNVTISIGVAGIASPRCASSGQPGHSDSCSAAGKCPDGLWRLVKTADKALYEAKRQGRNKTVRSMLPMSPSEEG